MDYFASILIAGFVGGALRGLVGYIKYHTRYKDIAFKPMYFFGMTGVSGLVGLLAAWVTKDLGITFLGMEQLSVSIFKGGSTFIVISSESSS